MTVEAPGRRSLRLADVTFEAMGTSNRVMIEAGPGPDPVIAAAAERARIEDFDRRLSRFRADSELSALNADPRERVPASRLLLSAVEAGLRGARISGGLADPTLVDEIEAIGYAASRERAPRQLLAEAIGSLADPRPAAPDPRRRWQLFRCDFAAGEITRPPGLRFDTGGCGKGLAADLCAERLMDFDRFLVSCGGDIRVGGTVVAEQPWEVLVAHPITAEPIDTLELAAGAVATSGIDSRLWREGDELFHHLLDPASGRPAWTGLLSVTALAPTGVEAEALAKAGFLSGAAGARRVLGRHGGVIVHDDGSWERIR